MTDPAKTVAFTGHRPEKIRGGKDETGAEVQHIKDELKRLTKSAAAAFGS